MTADADPPQRPPADAIRPPGPAGEPETERLAPIRGILVGLLLATIFWVIVVAATRRLR